MHTHITMKEMPESEKPYEKCIQRGAKELSDAELLAVILRTGTIQRTSLQTAQQLLRGGEGNLLNLVNLTIEEMQEIPGIGQVKAAQMKCVAELAMRIARTKRAVKISLNQPESVAGYYMETLRHESKEKLLLAMFDAKCNLLGDEVISVGTVNHSLVSPREVFLKALQYKAVHIVMLHNHPSGDPTPSEADKLVTKRIAACGEMMDILLADHIIIGDNSYISFREKGLLG